MFISLSHSVPCTKKLFPFLQMPEQVIPANHVGKFSPTNITVIATFDTPTVRTMATGSFPAHCVTAPMTNESDYAFIFFTCMKITVLTSVWNAGKPSHSHPALTSTCEYTAARGRTNALTVSRRLPLHLFCARISVSIAERNHSSANIAGALSPHMQRMIVTCGVFINQGHRIKRLRRGLYHLVTTFTLCFFLSCKKS